MLNVFQDENWDIRKTFNCRDEARPTIVAVVIYSSKESALTLEKYLLITPHVRHMRVLRSKRARHCHFSASTNPSASLQLSTAEIRLR